MFDSRIVPSLPLSSLTSNFLQQYQKSSGAKEGGLVWLKWGECSKSRITRKSNSVVPDGKPSNTWKELVSPHFWGYSSPRSVPWSSKSGPVNRCRFPEKLHGHLYVAYPQGHCLQEKSWSSPIWRKTICDTFWFANHPTSRANRLNNAPIIILYHSAPTKDIKWFPNPTLNHWIVPTYSTKSPAIPSFNS